MTAGTFHSVCRRLLARYGPLVGLPSSFTVLDAEDQAQVATIARDAVLAGRETRPALPKPATIVGWAALAAESGRPLEAVVLDANPRLGDRLEDLVAIAEGYAERKRAMAAVDYADLLVLTVRLLDEHPRVRRTLAETYRWILVDELHDANPVQARLVEAIAGEGGNLLAVADPDQSIYSWRGADPEVVQRFADVPGTRVFPLQTNYRSTPEVVGLAQATLPAGNPFGKSLRAARPASGAPPVVAHLASVGDEARFVVQRIADLITQGRAPGDIAVLYRAHHHSVNLQLALTEAGVEFEMFSGARFVESAHVKDVLAFCRLRHNPRDELAWHRALRLFDRVGESTAARTWAAIGATPDPLAAAAALEPSGPGSAGLRRFAEAIADVARMSRPEEIVLRVARADWYRDHLQRVYPNWRDREGDLARLAELATRATSLDRFLGRPPAGRAGRGGRGRLRARPAASRSRASTRPRASSGRWCSCCRSRPGRSRRAGPSARASSTRRSASSTWPSRARPTSSICAGRSPRSAHGTPGPTPRSSTRARDSSTVTSPDWWTNGPCADRAGTRVIVSHRAQGLVLVRQVDHQEQCALMAAAWGNDSFARIAPFAPLEDAAARHDEGWRRWEDAPEVRDGAAVDFTEIDRATHVELYRQAIDAARARDARAGLLVSMHGQGLYEGRGGLDPGPPPARAGRPAGVQAFLAEQDRVQAGLRRSIGEGPELDAWAWAAYRLLQTWDALSLYLTWRSLLAGRETTLPQVPREAGDPGLDLRVRPDGPMACTVDPWPFSGGEVALPVRARAVEDRPYADDLDLRESLGAAPWLTLAFSVRPA